MGAVESSSGYVGRSRMVGGAVEEVEAVARAARWDDLSA